MSNRPWFMVIVSVFGGDISGGAVDLDRAALLDARRDQRDIAVLLQRVDLGAVDDVDRAAVAGDGREVGAKPFASLLLSVGLIEVSSSPPTSNTAFAPTRIPFGAVEPDVAAVASPPCRVEIDMAVELDLPACRPAMIRLSTV